MKLPLIVESDNNGGLFAYLGNSSIVTYGDNMDEILANILDAIEQANTSLDDPIEISEITYNIFDEDDDDTQDNFEDD